MRCDIVSASSALRFATARAGEIIVGLFYRRRDRGQLLGVTAGGDGVAAAVIERPAGRAPRLTFAAHRAGTDHPALLKELARQRELRQLTCAGSVPYGEYSVVMVDAPAVPPAEMREAVRWRVSELIDFHVDDAVIDIFDVPSANEARGGRLYAVAARTAAVRRIVDELGEAGLKLEFIDIPEFALRNLSALLPEDKGGMAMVALEAERGLITVTRQGALYLSRRLDYGFERLAFDGSAMLTPEMEGMLDTLVIEIQRSLDYYERHFAQPAVQSVVLAPTRHSLTGAAAYLQAQLGVQVRELDLNVLLTPAVPLTASEQAGCLTAIGIALRHQEVAL